MDIFERNSARILCDDRVVGTGWLVRTNDNKTVLVTCAHVVNEALGRVDKSDRRDPGPDATITFDLPKVSGTATYDARRLYWYAPLTVNERINDPIGDIAAFLVRSRLPRDAKPLDHSEISTEILVNKPVRSFGYATDSGTVADAKLVGDGADNWLNFVGQDSHGDFFDGGFSGAPLRDEQNHLIGMAVAAFEPNGRRIGYAIPSSKILEAIPDIIQSNDQFYAVHDYDLLQTHLIGRKVNLARLDGWKTSSDSVCVLEQFGGFGKSALCWTWWEIQSTSQNWDAGFWYNCQERPNPNDLISELYEHLCGSPNSEQEPLDLKQMMDAIMKSLRRGSHLLVFDSFEHMLRISEEKGASSSNDNASLEAGSDTSAAKPVRSIKYDQISKLINRIAKTSAKLLLITRYFPQDLQTATLKPKPNVQNHRIDGLALEDVKLFWSELGLDEADPGLERLVRGVGGHPLSLSVMAGQLRASVSLEEQSLHAFFERNPNFPTLKDVSDSDGRGDVFADALRVLNKDARKALDLIALAEFPLSFSALLSVLQKTSKARSPSTSSVSSAEQDHLHTEHLENMLVELEDRQLSSRTSTNAWTMHPVLREAVRQRIDEENHDGLHVAIARFCQQNQNYKEAKAIEDLELPRQLFISLLETDERDRATWTWVENLRRPLRELGYHHDRAEISGRFFRTTRKESSRAWIDWIASIPSPEFPIIHKEDCRLGTSPEEVVREKIRSSLNAPEGYSTAFGVVHDAAMDAGLANVKIGDYDAARGFFELHNKVCGEPLCKTMQMDCLEEAGRYAESEAYLQQSISNFASSEVWQESPYEAFRLAGVLSSHYYFHGMDEPCKYSEIRALKILCRHGDDALKPDDKMSDEIAKRQRSIAKSLLLTGDHSGALQFASAALECSKSNGTRDEQLTSMRAVSVCHKANKDFAASALLEDVISDWLGVSDNGGEGLRDRARRAHNWIQIGSVDSAIEELLEVASIAESTGALKIAAETHLFLADAHIVKYDQAKGIKALNEALRVSATHADTPYTVAPVRNAIKRLEAYGKSLVDVLDEFGFVKMPSVPEHFVYGSDIDQVKKIELSRPFMIFTDLNELRDRMVAD